MNLYYIPNYVTVFRVLLVFPILVALHKSHYTLAFYLFILAGLSDGVDGFLARRYNWYTRFGSIMDPFADKFLMISTFFMLTYLQKIPLWLLLVVVVRDVIIISGGLAYHWLIGRFELAPSIISKVNTALQLLLIVTTLFQASYFMLPESWISNLAYCVLFTNLASLIHYVYVWSHRALRRVEVR